MFVRYTLIGGIDSNIVTAEKNPVTEEAERKYVLGGVLLHWQSNSQARQSIGHSKLIPRHHSFDNGLHKLEFELERQDLKDLFNLFKLPHNRRICVEEGTSEEAGLAELKVVYRLLKQVVREEE